MPDGNADRVALFAECGAEPVLELRGCAADAVSTLPFALEFCPAMPGPVAVQMAFAIAEPLPEPVAEPLDLVLTAPERIF